MVGMNTLIYDNPKLNVRYWNTNKQPLRVTLDERSSFIKSNHFFEGSQKSLVFNYSKEEVNDGVDFVKINQKDNIIEQLLERLREKKVGSILVEGGAKLLEMFLKTNLWDETRICTSPKSFGSGILAPVFQKPIDEEFFLEKDKWQISFNRPIGNEA